MPEDGSPDDADAEPPLGDRADRSEDGNGDADRIDRSRDGDTNRDGGIRDESDRDGGGHDGLNRDGPAPRTASDPPGQDPAERGWIGRFRHDRTGPFAVLREFLVSTLAVLVIGAVLFGVSGVWPPMVAVESGSMQPHMYRGDLVFIMEEERLAPDAAVEGTGVATRRSSREAGYWRFGGYGDVVVYKRDGSSAGSPIIHRAMFWVEAGENWYPRANKAYVQATKCGDSPETHLQNCPAPHAGFITKGDNNDSNPYYDQARGLSAPVKPSWIKGTARVRIPWLGHVRLFWAEVVRGASQAVFLLVFGRSGLVGRSGVVGRS